MADFKSTLPVTDSADGTDGATAPALTMQVGGKDSNGNLQTISTNTAGNVLVSERISQTAAAPTVATVGTSSVQVVASNTSRTGLVLVNNSGQKIYLGFGATAVNGSGILLIANGGTFTMDAFTYVTSAVNAIAGSGANNSLTIQEFS